MQKMPSINLVKGRSGTYIDRFMNWALSVGRLVVILTETIALAIFLTRFSYDRQISDLHTSIKRNQAVIQAYGEQEAKYRNLQDRIAAIAKLQNQGSTLVASLKDIILNEPNGVSIEQIAMEPDAIKVEGTFRSPTALGDFVKMLQENPAIASISLERVEDKTTSAVIFASITAKVKSK